MNTIHISGNIGVEPEFMVFESGTKKVTFSVALNQYGKDREKKETIWVPCQAWGAVYDRLLACKEKAALAGRRISVIGNFAQSAWKDQATGMKRTKLLVKVQSFELMGGKNEEPTFVDQPEENVPLDAEVEGEPAPTAATPRVAEGKPEQLVAAIAKAITA